MQSIEASSVRPSGRNGAHDSPLYREYDEVLHSARAYQQRVSDAVWSLEMALRDVRIAEREGQASAALQRATLQVDKLRGVLNRPW